MKILVTGCAGFIGHSVVKSLINKKNSVIGIDNLNNYYSQELKKDRLKDITNEKRLKNYFFKFYKFDLRNFSQTKNIFKKYKFDTIIHLAAQAGVRYSLENPRKYLESNVISFFNILELCRIFKVKHLVYASTSSVYGDNILPFSEKTNSDKPLQFYSATKKSNEVMSYAYSNIYKFKTTGLRFFTVYGPWGRPDMAYFKFANLINKNKSIVIHNKGRHKRDLTYIDDVVKAIKKIAYNKKTYIKKNNKVNSEIFNIGNSKTIKLIDMINFLEKSFNTEAKKKFVPMQPGEMLNTLSNSKKLKNNFRVKFSTPFHEGMRNFFNWYISYTSNKKQMK